MDNGLLGIRLRAALGIVLLSLLSACGVQELRTDELPGLGQKAKGADPSVMAHPGQIEELVRDLAIYRRHGDKIGGTGTNQTEFIGQETPAPMRQGRAQRRLAEARRSRQQHSMSFPLEHRGMQHQEAM